MSRALRFASAALVAAIVETGCLWVLTHVVAPHYLIAVALAFTTGYLTLFAGIRVLAPSCGNPPLSGLPQLVGILAPPRTRFPCSAHCGLLAGCEM